MTPARLLTRPSLAADASALLAALALLVAPVAAQQPERHTVSGDDVAVFNIAGVVRVERGSGSDVVVEVTRGGADAGRLRVETGAVRGRQTLRVVYPADRIVYAPMGRGSTTNLTVRDDGTWGEGRGFGGERMTVSGRGSGLDAHADLVVRVPAGRRLSVYLAVGDVAASNVDADLLVDVAAASVRTERTRGRLRLDTGSGEVHVTDAEGDVDLDTGSGDVTVTRMRGAQLSVDAGSGELNGSDIAVDKLALDLGSGGASLAKVSAKEVKLDSGSGDVDLGLSADVDAMVIDAGSGDVTLRVPSALGAEFDIDTGSGGIDSELPLTVTGRDESHMRGSIGDGRGRIRIDSGSGRVRLRKA